MKITKYSGSADYHVLERFVQDISMYFEASHLIGVKRDFERKIQLKTYLEGSADRWFRNRVVGVNRTQQSWTAEQVIVGLYKRFIRSITLHDNYIKFKNLTWCASDTIKGFYDEMVMIADSMAIPPSDRELLDKFMDNIPKKYVDDMIDKGYDVILDPLDELVDGAADEERLAYTRKHVADRRHDGVVAPRKKPAEKLPAIPHNANAFKNAWRSRLVSCTVVRPLGNNARPGAERQGQRDARQRDGTPDRGERADGGKQPDNIHPQRVPTNVKCHDCGREGQYRGHAGCPGANAPHNDRRGEKPAIRAARTDSGGTSG